MRNYRASFINGTSNVRTSTFKEHASTDMHARAMHLLKKQCSTSVVEYAPIARALTQQSMDERTHERMKRKFEVAYLIAMEKLAMSKMKPLCELEELHGVDIGPAYKNYHACATFVEFIARERQEQLIATLSQRKFFSLQADAGNIEDELVLVLHFDPFSSDGRVHVSLLSVTKFL